VVEGGGGSREGGGGGGVGGFETRSESCKTGRLLCADS